MEKRIREVRVGILFSLFFILGFLLFSALPDETYSKSERRELAKFPNFSVEEVISGRFMEGFEKYATDGVPHRDFFRSIKSAIALGIFRRKDNNGIYKKNGYLAKIEYPMKEEAIIHASKKFEKIYKKYGKGGKVYVSVIPDKGYFLAKEGGYPGIDYQNLEDLMKENTGFAEYISISDLLSLEDYYRTDTHWRQEKIKKVAKRLAEKMGTKLFWNYVEKLANPKFYGVYHGQLALPIPGEELRYLEAEEMKECKIYDLQNNREIGIYDEGLAMGRDGYEMFLSGSLSLIRMENPNAPKGKKLILFRDSFSSSLGPLLLSGYGEIIMVDIRYINSNVLDRFVEFENHDILFLYSTLVLNHSETLK